MTDYFNTNRLTGTELADAIAAARSQQDKILVLFRAYPGKKFTPGQVKDFIFSDATPLTSIRRAMTNLTDSGDLVKTNLMKSGRYGARVHYWTLANGNEKQRELF